MLKNANKISYSAIINNNVLVYELTLKCFTVNQKRELKKQGTQQICPANNASHLQQRQPTQQIISKIDSNYILWKLKDTVSLSTK